MKKKRWRKKTGLAVILLSLLLSTVNLTYAEEGAYVQEETQPETIEAYAIPIESNNTQNWPQGPQIEAEAAIVMEMETGTVLYAKNIKAKEYPASITKLMTVLIALENGNLDDTVTFSQEAVYSIEPGSSHLGIRPDEQLSLRQSLFGIMLASANDISNGVAEHIGGTIDHFVEMMNQKAQELGCLNTHFVNAHGLHDDNHYTCAYDMALIAQEVFQYPSFRTITKTVECSFPPTNVVDETRYFINNQRMLYDEEFKYEGCIGGKTGFTDQALNTLVTYAERDGTVLISVILKLNGAYKTFQESALLLDYGFENFEKRTFSNQGTDENFSAIAEANASEEFDLSASVENQSLVMDETSTVIVPKGIDLADLKTEMTKKDDDTGTLTYRYHGWPVGKVNVKYQEVRQTEAQTVAQTQSETAVVQTEAQENSPSIFQALNSGVSKISSLIEKADDYILNHKAFCTTVCVILLIIFIPLLILTYFRARKLSKRRKDIEWEKQEIARIEREIDEKTTEEIEMELRAAMKKEREAQEKAKKAMEELEEAKRQISEIEEKKAKMETVWDEDDEDDEDDEIWSSDNDEKNQKKRETDSEESWHDHEEEEE